MLECKFSFEVYTKNLQEKASGCSLETIDVPLDAEGHALT